MKRFVLLLCLAGFWSCQQANPALEIKQQRDEVERLEEKAKTARTYDPVFADSLKDAYLNFVKEYPQDSLSDVYLSRAADVTKEQKGKAEEAIDLYRQVQEDYPKSPLAIRARFMVAYVYDESLKNKEKAVEAYDAFIERYPEHPLAREARNLKALLQDSLSEEEMVQQWLQKEKQTQD